MFTLVDFLIVGAGSCLGGMSRYAVSRLITVDTQGVFPWGTLCVNLAGCLLIGLIYGAIARGFNLSEQMRLFLTVGFCGGFTTFSTFVHENHVLMESGSFLPVLLYVVVSLVGGLLLVYGGYWLTRSV